MDIDEQKLSPMMQQWHACKKVAGDALLLFRMGDFYEAFYDDAAVLSRELDLTLTSRQEIPMSGVPFHASDGYIDKLVGKGFRVAIAEQIEDAKQAKGLVKREVVRMVSPGTLINSSLLSDKVNNYFAALTQVGSIYGLSVIDLSTADFRVLEFDQPQELLNEIHRLQPSEFLVSQKFQAKHPDFFTDIKNSYDFLLNVYEDWRFEYQTSFNFLTTHFGVHNLDGFGLKAMTAGINAAGALLQYLHDTLCLPIHHIHDVHTYSTAHFMSLDRTTQRNLELVAPLHEGSRHHTLLSLLDHTQTPMGARLLKQWIKQPLLSVNDIYARQDAIEAFLVSGATIERLQALLKEVRDIERLMMKVSSGYAMPRDLVALGISFRPMSSIKGLLHTLSSSAFLQQATAMIDPLPEMTALIHNSIVDEPPLRLNEGNIFRDGYHQELDELRTISRNSQAWLVQYQTQLRETTGIKTLKVGYTRIFGYYIEVSRGQADQMPSTFQRRQTLTNSERFITPELKDFETKILTAEDRIIAIENELYTALRLEIAKYTAQVMQTAQALAKIDCILSLAHIALSHRYVRPIVDNSPTLNIIEGRHPVIEACTAHEKFVPNDTHLDNSDNRVLIITGPNMAGKSTYIRQVALITLLAQMGSFIPAKSAHIGIVDKIFTRIGASDDLARGQSTFMVEMTETANILHNATSRSLVILDEIGRGTSTYDGISIAWAVAEYLLLAEGKTPKTLFATHYWELTKLEGKVPGAVNYNVAVHESQDNIVFLRKIVRGGTDKSYGIHVARLAGFPPSVLTRAKEILAHLEENANRHRAFEVTKLKKPAVVKPKVHSLEMQLTFFEK